MDKSIIIRSNSIYTSYIRMVKRTIFLIFLLSIIFGLNIPVLAETSADETQNPPYHLYLPITQKPDTAIYVSPQGNDSNPGTYLRPLRTIDKAANMVEPGEMVYVRGGIYYETVRIYNSGTATMPIKIMAYPGENPVVDGQNTDPGEGAGLLVLIGDYIYASGLEVRNSAYDGIQVLGNYDVVVNMFVHHCQKKGVFINGGHHSIVENNRIWWNSTSNEYGQSGSWSSGITASRAGISYATIRNNTVWENWGQGINTYEADHTLIEGNIVHDNFAANIYIHDATNILCQRNFIYTDQTNTVFQYGTHIGIMMGDEREFPSSNITIINNITFGNNWNYALYTGTNIIQNILISNNSFVNGTFSGGVILKGDHQNINFTNNLVQQDGDLPIILITDNPDINFSNNLWSKTPPSEAVGPGDIIGPPLLAMTGDPFSPEWFKLTSFSPAIDGATSLPEVIVDYFGKNREAPPDIGANEFFPP